MKNQVGKFINRESARVAALAFFMAASTENDLVTMGHYLRSLPIWVTIHTDGRRIPITDKLPGFNYSSRRIDILKREDWTNYTCFTYYFDF